MRIDDETRMPRKDDPDRERGLYRKFDVRRSDPDAEARHVGCFYFVLDIRHDILARPALQAYSTAARTAGYVALADDIDRHLSVTERD